MRRRFFGALAALTCAAAAHGQALPHTALDFVPGGTYLQFPGMLGWEFIVNTPISVAALDVWDLDGDGFLEGGHEVGIWDSQGNLMTSTIVTSTSTAHPGLDPFGVWRYNTLSTPVSLAGGTYTIGALYGGLDQVSAFTPPVTLPQISYLQDASTFGASIFGKPVNTGLFPVSFYGPSFHIGTNAPEPGSFVLVGIGIVSAALARRRRAAA